jgi:hypothetical protein
MSLVLHYLSFYFCNTHRTEKNAFLNADWIYTQHKLKLFSALLDKMNPSKQNVDI